LTRELQSSKLSAMEFKDEQIQSLVNNPTESFDVELKRWIDPAADDGVVKIAKACIAMRNNNGGFIVIGFDNETLLPDPKRPTDVHATFHFDTIQGIVSKFTSEVFEVALKFGKRDGQDYPVICVPSGVRTPIASKSGLKVPDGTQIKDNQVYVRTLNANGIVSTSEAKWQDWEKLVTICMDNREADVGRFIRRHISTADVEKLRTFFAVRASETVTELLLPRVEAASETQVEVKMPAAKTDAKSELMKLLDNGASRYATVADERGIKVAKHGSFEAGFCIEGLFPSNSANQAFLNKMLVSNPRLTGWPFWMDSRGFVQGKQTAPYHVEGGWEAFIPLVGPDAVQIWEQVRGHLDFWQMFPNGRFYHRRALEDDAGALTPDNPPKYLPPPNVALDFGLPILRVYEVLVIGLRFASALGCEPTQTTVKFGFRWSGLKGRVLSTWAEPSRLLYDHGPCYQDVVSSTVEASLETAESALFQQTHQATVALYEAFDGFEISSKFIEDFTGKTFATRR
jgi:hypothetical protein